jgi:hypothetical protein
MKTVSTTSVVSFNELPNNYLVNRAKQIADKENRNSEALKFRKTGKNTFKMFEGNTNTGWTWFVAENEID